MCSRVPRREHDVREVLTRHVGLESSEDNKARESFLQNELHIPPKWIHHAKVTLRGFAKLIQSEITLEVVEWVQVSLREKNWKILPK